MNNNALLNIENFWKDVISQNRTALPHYFTENAIIRWHCTNEQFTKDEYVQINCDYPDNWKGEIERIERTGDSIILAGHVFSVNENESYHVASFIKCKGNLIQELDEYWAEDGDAPEWRKNMKIGRVIR